MSKDEIIARIQGILLREPDAISDAEIVALEQAIDIIEDSKHCQRCGYVYCECED